MMTAASIKAANAIGYGEYLESKTIAPERGDYYVGRDGTPAESPGRWIGDPDARASGSRPVRSSPTSCAR